MSVLLAAGKSYIIVILIVPLPVFALLRCTDTFPKYRGRSPCQVPENESRDIAEKSHFRDCGLLIPNRKPVLHAGDTRTERVKQKQAVGDSREMHDPAFLKFDTYEGIRVRVS